MKKSILWKLYSIDNPTVLIIGEEYINGERIKLGSIDITEEAKYNETDSGDALQELINEYIGTPSETSIEYQNFIDGKYAPDEDLFIIVCAGLAKCNDKYIDKDGITFNTQTAKGMAIPTTPILFLNAYPGMTYKEWVEVREDYGLETNLTVEVESDEK